MQIPIYAHVKQTLDPLLGRRDGIEINYMKFLAYNGPYKLFHTIWVGALGAHDADWYASIVRQIRYRDCTGLESPPLMPDTASAPKPLFTGCLPIRVLAWMYT